MTSTGCALRYGAAIGLLWIVGATPSPADEEADSPSFLLAQNEAAPDQADATAEPMDEKDPVKAAEQAVDDARAALRHAMATGGDVRGARRNLQTAIRNLNDDKTAANESDSADAMKTVEVPALDVPSGQISDTTVPEAATPKSPPKDLPQLVPPQAPATLPTLPQPPPLADTNEVSSDASNVETATKSPPPIGEPTAPPTPIEPATPPAAPQDLASPAPLPTTPLPPANLPTLPAPGEAPTAADSQKSAGSPPPDETSTQATVGEPSGKSEKSETKSGPGFFQRLFGRDDEKRNERAKTRKDEKEAEETTAKADGDTKPTSAEPEPSLPIFKKLPPLQGPKVVAVTPGAAEVVEEPDEKRVIVKKGGRMTIIHDDNDRFRRKGEDVKVEKGQGGTTITTVTRRNGNQVITVRSEDGEILQRYRKKRNGEIDMLIGDRDRKGRPRGIVDKAPRRTGRARQNDFATALPRLVVPIPLNQYIVGSQESSRSQMQQALIAPPIEPVERAYSLEEIQQSERLRAKLRRIDIDTVNFEFGAATIAEDQVPNLQAIGNALSAIIADDPSQVFFIEGHTDAVGSNRSNLALSDRRAESIAQILTFYFNIPPENLITKGYGEQYLKVLTAGPERRNRRGSVRNITSLLVGQAQ